MVNIILPMFQPYSPPSNILHHLQGGRNYKQGLLKREYHSFSGYFGLPVYYLSEGFKAYWQFFFGTV